MNARAEPVDNAIDVLNLAYLVNFPRDAARKIESMLPSQAADIFSNLPTHVLPSVWKYLSPGIAEQVLLNLDSDAATTLLINLDAGPCAALLSRLDATTQQKFLAPMPDEIASELRELLQYPADSAGKLMDTRIIALNENISVRDALQQLRSQRLEELHHLFLLDNEMHLSGQLEIHKLVLADGDQKLLDLADTVRAFVTALDPRSEITDRFEKYKVDILPVIDANDFFVGIIRASLIVDVLKENLTTDMQTMVGVSKDERALSSSWFVVRKRLPWLQINLLTAFLASAVVGMFADTIAKFTALAILLPIAAGQSGNTGAQALAVTMRGLTLREITVRHWLAVTMKEAVASLVNGIAIAITCGIGVYFWSQSTGLALIIGLAMISSMMIAAVSGALVPIVLKRMGQDPALSSSIILTTVTDIAGFMSFLGIATLLSGMLETG